MKRDGQGEANEVRQMTRDGCVAVEARQTGGGEMRQTRRDKHVTSVTSMLPKSTNLGKGVNGVG